MDIALQIDEPFAAGINAEKIKTAVQKTVQLYNKNHLPVNSITVTITNNKTLEQLNCQYRGINAPTDVLSFKNNPDPDFPDVDPAIINYLGDVVIYYPVAKAQAKARGHTLLGEITLLAVHGTLHLLGFDHDTPDRKEKMWAAQYQIMTSLGLAHIQPTES